MATPEKDAPARISAYIESLPEWSNAICKRLREIIRSADATIQEEWKWGPHYSSHGMVCGYSAFQKHVKLHFFNGAGMTDEKKLFNHCMEVGFSRSLKLTDVGQIDAAVLKAYIQEAIAVNKKGFKRVVADKTVAVPEELKTALEEDEKAKTFFENLSYGYKKEFAEHITGAKGEKTKQARTAKVVALCAAGKTLNDKYKKTAASR